MCDTSTISKIVEEIEDDTDILSASVIVVDEVYKKEYVADNHHVTDKIKYNGGMIQHQGMFVRTALGKQLKFDTSYKIAADYKFFLQCYYNDAVNIKYIDDSVAFYSYSVVSSNGEACNIENMQIHQELNIPIHCVDMPIWKKCLKVVLQNIGLLEVTKNIKQDLRRIFVLQKHHCDNRICRWCGRD